MENIGYIYAASAYEAPESIDEVVPFLFDTKKLPSFAAIRLLSVAITLFLLSTIGQALAVEKYGSKGTSVADIQKCLQQLDYFNGSVTGYYGSITKSAVMQFQKDNGLAIDGIVGSDTQKNIQSKCSARLANNQTNPTGVLKLGSRSQAVKTLQQDLKQLNYFVGNPTGYFGPVTKDAVINFQKKNRLNADGIAGKTTLVAIEQSLTKVSQVSQSNNNGVGGENFTLRLGSRGAEVTSLQQRLQKLNYLNVKPTGYYGAITRDAVIRFQKDQKLTVDGIAGAKTQQVIDQQIQRLLKKPSTETILPLTVGACSNGKCPTLRENDRNRYVTYLQTRLRDWGYFKYNPNGNYDSETVEAVKRFQRDNGLLPDGAIGPQTWQKIEIPQNCNQPTLQRGDKGECVTRLQTRLRELGYLNVNPTSYFSSETWEAVKRLQRDRDLPANGIVDSRTWKALETNISSNNRYLVLVPVTSSYTLNELRRIVPDAFIRNSRLGQYVQIAEFLDNNRAQQHSQSFRDRGFDARVIAKDRV